MCCDVIDRLDWRASSRENDGGQELEKRLDAKLLFNHQTIDLFANFLGYSPAAFALSNQTRIELFKAFVHNEANNTTKSIIFTVLIDFDQSSDLAFYKRSPNYLPMPDKRSILLN